MITLSEFYADLLISFLGIVFLFFSGYLNYKGSSGRFYFVFVLGMIVLGFGLESLLPYKISKLNSFVNLILILTHCFICISMVYQSVAYFKYREMRRKKIKKYTDNLQADKERVDKLFNKDYPSFP